MKEKKNILVICSWLNVKEGIGSFFVEQAKIVSKEFTIKLVVFEGFKFGISKNKKISFSIKFEKEIIENNFEAFTITYPIFKIPILNHFIEKKITNKITQLFSNNKVDLVHAQSIFDAGFWAFKIFKIKNIPYIFTEHNQFSLKGVKRDKLKILEKVIDNASSKLVVSNDLIRQFATNYMFNYFKVVGNTFDESIFNYSPSQNLKFSIVSIGAYAPIKDYKTMFQALKIIEAKLCEGQEICFYWIGYNGWGENKEVEVNQLIKDCSFKKIEIILIGKLDRNKVATILNKSNVFISTSICETFGVSVLEALACGVPVIVTQSGGINELVDEYNGIIVPIKEPNEIANHVLNLIDGKKQYDYKNIALSIKSKFGSTIFKDKISEIYNTNFKN